MSMSMVSEEVASSEVAVDDHLLDAGTITVTVEQQGVDVDFGMELAPTTDEALGGQQIEEIVVKTDSDDPTKLIVLPPIPFSFPGQTFDTKCQKLILNVWDFFKRVKKNPDILDEIRTPQERAAAALHISAATIGKIGKNLKKTGKLETPGMKRKRSRPIVDSVNNTDEDVIRQIISEMRAQKITPTLPMVLTEARHRINFTGGATSFRRILQRMGFKNLSQKNIVKPKVDTPVQYQAQPATATFGGLKVVKKEPISTISTGIQLPLSNQTSGTTILSPNSVASSSNTQTANIIQIGNTSSGQPIQLTQEGAATLLNAAQVSGISGGGTQTFYIQQADNTIRPIQIVYASNLT